MVLKQAKLAALVAFWLGVLLLVTAADEVTRRLSGRGNPPWRWYGLLLLIAVAGCHHPVGPKAHANNPGGGAASIPHASLNMGGGGGHISKGAGRH